MSTGGKRKAAHAKPQSKGRGRRVVALLAALVVIGGGAAYGYSRMSAPPATESNAETPSGEQTPEVVPGWRPTQEEIDEARAIADAMPLEELAGQLIVARHFSDEASLQLVREKHFAGVLVTGDRILDITSSDPLSTVTDFNDQLRAAGEERGVPVMIPIDQEGGLVARLKAPLTEFPTFMSAGAAVKGDPAATETVKAAARASGAELKAAGFNTVFAPGGDSTIGIEDPIIGTRSAGSDPEVVTQASMSAVEGYSESGIISSLKHFPGHNVAEDSHRGLPELTSDEQRLRSHDLVPFMAGVEKQIPSIMTGHLDVTALDPGEPASTSSVLVTDLLRDELGYDGLIVSDSLGMGGVMSRYPGGEAAVAVIKAGSDLALMPADNDAAYDAMLAALESGEIPEQQARDSAARTIAWLMHAEATQAPPGDAGSHTAESKALSAAALTVVEGECTVEPATSFRVFGSADLVQAFAVAAQEAGLSTGSGPSVALIGTGGTPANADIVVTTDRPFALTNSTATTKIALYGAGEPAMAALIDFLTGKADAPGRVPVDGMTDAGC